MTALPSQAITPPAVSEIDSLSHAPSQGSVHLDALRGAAALLVFANHTRALYFSSLVPSTQPVTGEIHSVGEFGGELKVASAAVVIFFVLSGYLVGGSAFRSMRTRRWSWSSYTTKRLVRLLVVLIPAVLIGALLDHIGLRIFGSQSIYGNPVGVGLGVSVNLQERLRPLVLLGNLTFLQGILVPMEGTNLSLWSLSNEFWYYIAFPLAITVAFPQFSRLTRTLSLLAACAVIWFMGPKVSVLFPIWIMGTAISVLPVRISPRQARVLSLFSLVALVLGILGLRLLHATAVPAEFLIGGLTSVLLYGLVCQTGVSRAGVYRSVAGFFSQISYSLYMFHLPLAVFCCAVLDSPWRLWTKSGRHLALFGLSDLVVLTVVYLLWRAFEANTDRVRSFMLRREGLKTGRLTRQSEVPS